MARFNNDTISGNISQLAREGGDYPGSLHIGLLVIGIPLGLAITVGNILLLIVFKSNHKNPQKSFKSKTTVILSSMSVGEVLAGIILLTDLGLYSSLDSDYLADGCYVWNVIKLIPLLGGFLHLAALGIERYVVVNQTPYHPNMKKLILGVCILWIYGFVAAFVAYAFKGRQTVYRLCDVLTIPSIYVVVVVFSHVMVCVIACSALVLIVRNVIKLHQQKIQVSNTITYQNTLGDIKSAQLFYIVTVVSFVIWMPFLVCGIFLVAGQVTNDAITASRWSFLLGHMAYTKCYWYMIGSAGLRADFKRTFGKAENRPLRMGSARTRVG